MSKGEAGPVTVQTRHIYSGLTLDTAGTAERCGSRCDSRALPERPRQGLNTVAEYISCDDGENWDLGREFLWGDRFPEPLVLIDYTAAGVVGAGSEEVLHYIRDALGSVVGLLDAGEPDATPDPIAPKMVERYDYDPYGKTYIDVWDGESGTWQRVTSSVYGNPFAWTGQRYDAGVGMYHFPFRSYSPELGRWMQRDPLGYVDGVNLYGYAACMAARVTDPLGLLLRDGGGNIVVSHNANPVRGYMAATDGQGQVAYDESGEPLIALVEQVTIYTDDGTPITAYLYISGNLGALTDCHGVTFADGKLWVNDDQVEKILEGDHYELVAELGPTQTNDVTDAQVGDIVVYYGPKGVIHSLTVVGVDPNGGITVMGLGGWYKGLSASSVLRGWVPPWEWIFVRVYRPSGFWNYPYIYRDVMLREAIRWWADLFKQLMMDHWAAEARRWGHWTESPGPCD